MYRKAGIFMGKILLINGSPHEKGCTYTALAEVAASLHACGIETELFWLGTQPVAGCIACRKCEKACPTQAVTVNNNLASIDYDKCINCGACAEACPVHCIKYADFSGKHRQNHED